MSTTHRILPGTTVFALTGEEALVNYAINNTLNGTCDLGSTVKEDKLLEMARAAAPEFVARLAVYAYKTGKMRDVSAFLTAYISQWPDLFKKVAPLTIDNIGQLRKFVNVKRGGMLGTRSLGSAPKNFIGQLVTSMKPRDLFYQSQGGNPTLADIIKLAHIKPTPELQAYFKYELGFDLEDDQLLPEVRLFNEFVKGNVKSDTLPAVPVRLLSSHVSRMSDEQKLLYLGALSPNQLRRELNMLDRAGVFKLPGALAEAVEKLGKLTKNFGTTLPTSLYNTVRYTSDLPVEIRKALVGVLEHQLVEAGNELNALLSRPVTVAIDCSGSMSYNKVSLAKGGRPERRTIANPGLSCFEAACLFAYPLYRNASAEIVLVDGRLHKLPDMRAKATDFNSYMEYLNARNHGGSTALSEVIRYTETPDTIIISDNESWRDDRTLQSIWCDRVAKQDDSRLILWDIVPSQKTPALSDSNTLNLGGISEQVYNTVIRFIDTGVSTVDQIRSIEL